jgi:F420H(2)-dependent quinone reductase
VRLPDAAGPCDTRPVAARRVGSLLVQGVLRTHVWVYRRSRGRVGGSVAGAPLLLLTTSGRRSGAPRTRPLGFLRDDGGFIVCGSNGGSPRTPAWSLNLRHNPSATVEVGDETMPVRAAEATGEDYEQLWGRFTAAYPRFRGYRGRTTRHLPLFRLQPSTRQGA